MPIAREVRVHGRVQGVFFRDTCEEEARSHSVAGWVSNEADGTVLARFEGEQRAVEAMLDWCRTGPRRAQVQAIDVTDVEPEGLSEFEVR